MAAIPEFVPDIAISVSDKTLQYSSRTRESVFRNTWGWPTVNHTRIAAEAIRYRLDLVRSPLIHLTPEEVERMAGDTVAAAEPLVDIAIRRIATAWIDAGINPELLCNTWDRPAVRCLFEDNPQLVDALDDIIRIATRSMAA